MENNQSQKEVFLKMNFFKKVWYSITKFEKYPELAALGFKKAIIYFTQIVIIFSIIYTGTFVYYVSNVAQLDEENLGLSEKIVKIMTRDADTENEQVNQAISIMNEYSDKTIIGALFISIFISFFIATLMDVFTLSIFGMLTCIIAKIKMNYKAVFNMSIYALTLPVILRTIYVMITMLTTFEVKYFGVMYTAIGYITLAAAIFLIKSDVIKQHLELMKIIEESKEKIEQTITIPKKPKEDDEDEEKKQEDDENKKEEKGAEGQSSNA